MATKRTRKDETRQPVAPAESSIPARGMRREESYEFGKKLRDACPKRAHAGWKAPANRLDPVQLVLEAEKGRMPELLPLRHGRMARSAFTFFRGADETLPAPWEWDVKRLSASFVVACRDNGLSETVAKDVATTCVRTYRESMAEFSQMRTLELWYMAMEAEALVANIKDVNIRKRTLRRLQKERARSIAEDIFPKLVDKRGESPVIKDQLPTIFHLKEHPPGDFFLRRLRDIKISLRVETFGAPEMEHYATWCGRALALSHARSGSASPLSGYMGTSDALDRAIASFTTAYADQNEKDHAAPTRAIQAGKIEARFEEEK